jgi:hypothetical protein
MARAYICLMRNDLDDNLLQVLDLYPNSSQETIFTAYRGQTGYVTWMPQRDTVALQVNVMGNDQTVAAYYGLAAYLVDNVDNNNGGLHLALTAANANDTATAIIARLAAGTTIGLTEINADLAVATGGMACTLTTNRSTGSVEEVLRILSGEAYYLPANSVVSTGGGHTFNNPNYRRGMFLAATARGTVTLVAPDAGDDFILGGVSFHAANVEDAVTRRFDRSGTNAQTALSLATVINDPRNQALIGAANTNGAHRTVTATARLLTPGSNVVVLLANQPGTDGMLSMATLDTAKTVISGATLQFIPGGYRGHRLIADTGELHLSKLLGALSHLTAATYTWLNPAFTYGAAGTALSVDGTTHIGVTGAGAAVAVYDAAGNVI